VEAVGDEGILGTSVGNLVEGTIVVLLIVEIEDEVLGVSVSEIVGWDKFQDRLGVFLHVTSARPAEVSHALEGAVNVALNFLAVIIAEAGSNGVEKGVSGLALEDKVESCKTNMVVFLSVTVDWHHEWDDVVAHLGSKLDESIDGGDSFQRSIFVFLVDNDVLDVWEAFFQTNILHGSQVNQSLPFGRSSIESLNEFLEVLLASFAGHVVLHVMILRMLIMHMGGKRLVDHVTASHGRAGGEGAVGNIGESLDHGNEFLNQLLRGFLAIVRVGSDEIFNNHVVGLLVFSDMLDQKESRTSSDVGKDVIEDSLFEFLFWSGRSGIEVGMSLPQFLKFIEGERFSEVDKFSKLSSDVLLLNIIGVVKVLDQNLEVGVELGLVVLVFLSVEVGAGQILVFGILLVVGNGVLKAVQGLGISGHGQWGGNVLNFPQEHGSVDSMDDGLSVSGEWVKNVSGRVVNALNSVVFALSLDLVVGG